MITMGGMDVKRLKIIYKEINGNFGGQRRNKQKSYKRLFRLCNGPIDSFRGQDEKVMWTMKVLEFNA